MHCTRSGACIVPYGPCPCKWNPEYYLGAALHQVQRLNQTYRHFTRIEYASETLSRIPSIIYGLVGMLLFSNNFGTCLLTGMLTLVVMNLPTVTRTTQESLKTVPQSYREGAFGLGAGKWRVIRTVVLPECVNGVIMGCILSVGCILGGSFGMRRFGMRLKTSSKKRSRSFGRSATAFVHCPCPCR